MKSLSAFSFAIVSSLCWGQYSGSKTVPSQWKAGFDLMTIEKARPLLSELAGPDFRGRNPMNGDFNLAAGWLVAQLADNGIQPGGDNGTYFHRFTVWDTTPIPEATQLRSEDGKTVVPYGADFSMTSTGQFTWPAPKFAFIDVPKSADWKSLDLSKLKDRWVFLSPSAAENGELRRRLNGADGQPRPGQAGVFVANGRTAEQKVRPTKTRSVKDLPDPRRQPIGNLSFSVRAIDQLATACQARAFLSSTDDVASLETSDLNFFIDTKVTSTEFPMVNVIGKIEGSDQLLKSEAVIVGSHLDHLGPTESGTLFGADDNASGCTVNLMIAQAIKANRIQPKRSVYCCFWSCEELGLLGSFAFVQRPTLPLKSVVAYINMDMVGRNENDPRFKEKAEDNSKSVYPSGVAFNSPDFLKLLFDQNLYVRLDLKPDVEDRIMRSDSGSFAWKEIPTVKVFTGDHEDYHKATDTIEKINWEKMVNIGKWLYLTVAELATNPQRPKWEPSSFKAKPWQDPRINLGGNG